MQQLIQLYKQYSGKTPASCEPLAQAGSNRKYFRLTADDGTTCIGVIGTSQRENHSFLYLSRHFKEKNLPVPEIYAVSEDESRYLQEDLGNTSLFSALRRGREANGDYNQEEIELIKRTIKILPHFQIEGNEGLDYTQLIAPTHFNIESVMFDLNYFKYCFLKTTDIDFDEVLLQRDLEQFAADLCTNTPHFFLYRDFQARNVMLKEGKPYFIDFQGGKAGPLQYDISSFLWQASAKYGAELRQDAIKTYLEELQHISSGIAKDYTKRLPHFVLFRQLQVLGAYGLRGLFEHKQHFLQSIPPALKNLRLLLDNNVTKKYKFLNKILRRLTELPAYNKANERVKVSKNKLIVSVWSFSYKKGLPADESGNGGGYYFDCRSTHNPGRYERYKQLTGLDAPVIQFLEEDGEILPFLEHAYALVDFHVNRYIERDFTHLMVCFGCTGGQHRSVYSAQHVAEHIHNKFGVEVRLCHREQGIMQILK
ncbi:hypothetical protein HMPREF9332_01745 [Alloprevotella rava F0323]|uniref:Uncharacterized protein n=1 Tax=Alloprevotella rava F0323 TaxID=679199 RepID=G5GDU3_9BACT|nr:RNase adapter RapZ [Alloprevotella rava]EHG21226.1 hypothetical protein HMPREF9332_01745 [Alloprevotella rava F0323]